MAKVAKYTKQFPFVGTPTHESLILAVGELINDNKAPIVRFGLDKIFDLNDGELKPGDTIEAAAKRVAEQMLPVYGSGEGVDEESAAVV